VVRVESDESPVESLPWPQLQEESEERVVQAKRFLEKYRTFFDQLLAEDEGSIEPQYGPHDKDVLTPEDIEVVYPARKAHPEGSDEEAELVGSSGSAVERKMLTPWLMWDPVPVDREGQCVASPTMSQLPCMGYRSWQKFHWNGVLMDEERVLGIIVSLFDCRLC